MLNEDGNLIDVDAGENEVFLRGHVKSEKLKNDAAEIANKIIQENGSKVTLKNELVVK
jgi:hypothetical protein